MVDVKGEWNNSIQTFCLIADLVTAVVGVAEKDPSGFLVEQGLLAGTEEYFSKSHVLKREYPGEESSFSWMETGVFDLLADDGRLYRWWTADDLVEAVGELP
jgi:hypothetical protein